MSTDVTTKRILTHLERTSTSQSGSARNAPISLNTDVRSYHDQSNDDDWAHSGDPESASELLNFPPRGRSQGTSDTQIPSLKSRRSWTALPWQNRVPRGDVRGTSRLEPSTTPNATRHDAAASADRRGSDDRRGPRGPCEDHQ